MADIATLTQNAKTFGEQFIATYYQVFDNNRTNIAAVFGDVSIIHFEGSCHIGRVEIMKKLEGLPFKTIKHIVTTTDVQPTIDNGFIIHVLGQLKTDDDAPHGFSETFHIKKDAADNPIVLNSVFRLNLHHM